LLINHGGPSNQHNRYLECNVLGIFIKASFIEKNLEYQPYTIFILHDCLQVLLTTPTTPTDRMKGIAQASEMDYAKC
jgi:tryptophan synthase alpha subunit